VGTALLVTPFTR